MAEWHKKIGAVHFAHLLLALVVLTSVFSMIGCISEAPGIYQLFIAELHNSNVQFGYVGICRTISQQDRVCVLASRADTADLAKTLSLPLDVIEHVLTLQSSVSLALPAMNGILILVGHVAFLIALLSTDEKSVKSRRRWVAITGSILWSSVCVASAAAYLQNFSIGAMVTVPKSSAMLAVTRGSSLQALQWVVLSFSVVYVIVVLYTLYKTVKQEREGILPTSTDAGKETAAPSIATQTEPPAANQTSSGTQSDSPTIADLVKALTKIAIPKKAVQDSEAQNL